MPTPKIPPMAARVALAVAGTFMITAAALGVAAHLAGHTPPSHPYAEFTLGILGATTLLGTHPAAGGGRLATAGRLVAGLLGGIGAVLWAISAFGGLSD